MVKQSLFRFAAHVSIALYIALLFSEYLRPGFVSTVMNVHVMWVIIVPLVLMVPRGPAVHGGKIASQLARVIVGVILALIVWHIGEVFEGMRFWFAVAVGCAPLALFRYPR